MRMITIVELPEYMKRIDRCLSKNAQAGLIHHLAVNPNAGDIIQGTGGVRKIRWATENQGKSGASRIIYFYHNQTKPLYLITAFKKNEQSNLSGEEKEAIKKLTAHLKK
jgi:hypothetical protein